MSINKNRDEQILRDADISPKVNKLIKQAKKGKNYSITEKTLPSRSHLKEGVNTLNKQ